MSQEKNHNDHGKTSKTYINTKELLHEIGVKKGDTFLDAGCGEGYVALEACEILGDNSTIYAADIYEPFIEDLKNKNIKNLIPIVSNLSENIAIEDNTIDVSLMINVFHGFNENNKIDEAIGEFKRISKENGKIAIIDFKKHEIGFGPSVDIRLTPKELEKYFKKHDLNLIHLNTEIGMKLDDDYTHYLAIFKMEN